MVAELPRGVEVGDIVEELEGVVLEELGVELGDVAGDV